MPIGTSSSSRSPEFNFGDRDRQVTDASKQIALAGDGSKKGETAKPGSICTRSVTMAMAVELFCGEPKAGGMI